VTRLEPLKLKPAFKEKIWGSTNLAPVFGEVERPIGEAWYTSEQNTVVGGSLGGRSIGSLLAEFGPRLMGSGYQVSSLRRRSADPSVAETGAVGDPYFPILTKLLFPSQKLSVQVHPDDTYAIEHEDGPGKTEMWYVLAAKPDARIALGLTEDLSPGDLAESARTGEIEKYLRWVPVTAGQVVFVPPGTLHTLGEGVVICEIQQNSDLTYRFYDFGRVGGDGQPRALHIDQAARVTDVQSRPSPTEAELLSDGPCRVESLAHCEYFSGQRLSWGTAFEYHADPERAHILIVIEGSGSLNQTPFGPGDAFLIPAEAESFAVEGEGVQAIRAFVP